MRGIQTGKLLDSWRNNEASYTNLHILCCSHCKLQLVLHSKAFETR